MDPKYAVKSYIQKRTEKEYDKYMSGMKNHFYEWDDMNNEWETFMVNKDRDLEMQRVLMIRISKLERRLKNTVYQ